MFICLLTPLYVDEYDDLLHRATFTFDISFNYRMKNINFLKDIYKDRLRFTQFNIRTY